MAQAVDYSVARPNPAELAQRFVGALRYLAPLPNSKVVTRAEIDALHAAGMAVGFVWETTSSRAGQGYGAGVIDGQSANGLADNIGIPDTVTIYYAVDFDANPDDIIGYFRGVLSVGRRPVGGYGSYSVVERLLDEGLITKAWQTVAWSRGKRSARAVLYQRADAAANPPPGTDVNDVLADDWGQWSLDTLQPAHRPPPRQEYDMTPAIAIDNTGRRWELVVGDDQQCYAFVDDKLDPVPLGGKWTSGLTAFPFGDRIAVAGRGVDGALWHLTFFPPNAHATVEVKKVGGHIFPAA